MSDEEAAQVATATFVGSVGDDFYRRTFGAAKHDPHDALRVDPVVAFLEKDSGGIGSPSDEDRSGPA
jgi:hypothetical protein